MLDGLLGKNFSAKCKQSVKCTMARVLERRKKKQALINFLKKDIVELLTIEEEDNAFKRMDGLILEMNRVACYDMIDKFCEHILGMLPTLQKQKECPEEAMEAVATLIYATARFSDLPELCDLRLALTNRYGSTMESSLNQEFVENVSKKTFSMEMKLKIMQEIAIEFSVNWDWKNFGKKKTMLIMPDQKHGSTSNISSLGKQHVKQTNVNHKHHVPLPNPKKQEVHSLANEIHMISGANNVYVADPVKRDLVDEQQKEHCNSTSPLRAKTKTTEKSPLTEDLTNKGSKVAELQSSNRRTVHASPPPPYVHPINNSSGVSTDHVERESVNKQEKKGECDKTSPLGRESKITEKSPIPEGYTNKGGKLVELQSTSRRAVHSPLPPYVNSNENSHGVSTDKGCEGHCTSTTESPIVGTTKPEKIAVNIVPPYVQDKGLESVQPTGGVQHPSIVEPPVEHVNRNDTPRISRIPPYFKPSTRKIEDRTDMVGEERKKPIAALRNKQSFPTTQRRCEDAFVDADERIDQIVFGRRPGNRRGTRSFDAVYDEEDVEIDRLLMHYSSKGVHIQPEKPRKDRKVHCHIENGGVKVRTDCTFTRVASLPPERTTPGTPSMYSDIENARAAQVHPRLPDYVELAERFNALRRK